MAKNWDTETADVCRLPEFIPDEKMEDLLDNTPLFLQDKEGYRNKIIIELFYDTGIREMELINIK